MIFRNVVPYYVHFLTVNVAMMCVTPMDRHGYFNLSCSTGVAKGILNMADIVILEINDRIPRIYGGFDESIHISEVDYIVEGPHPELLQIPTAKPGREELAIADQIVPLIRSGSTLQLGIGGMPGVTVPSDRRPLSAGLQTEEWRQSAYMPGLPGKRRTRRPGQRQRDRRHTGHSIRPA